MVLGQNNFPTSRYEIMFEYLPKWVKIAEYLQITKSLAGATFNASPSNNRSRRKASILPLRFGNSTNFRNMNLYHSLIEDKVDQEKEEQTETETLKKTKLSLPGKYL